MLLYHVRFLREVEASGHRFSILQRVVPVPECDDRDEAIRLAQQKFARLERVPDWRLRADFVEISVADRIPAPGLAA